MQRGKNMAKTMKFLYVLILFSSMFLVIRVSDSIPYVNIGPCVKDKDRRKVPQYNIKCRNGECVRIRS
ncbi:putative Late nodulin [Medicago truncatula]|nr:putative Late nodulin [Medicago truncatula]